MGEEALEEVQDHTGNKTAEVLKKPGRKPVEASDSEKETIQKAYREHKGLGAVVLERVIDFEYGTRIPHNRTHKVLKSLGLALNEPRKQKRKKWIRYERKYSNSIWHTDWKVVEGHG